MEEYEKKSQQLNKIILLGEYTADQLLEASNIIRQKDKIEEEINEIKHLLSQYRKTISII